MWSLQSPRLGLLIAGVVLAGCQSSPPLTAAEPLAFLPATTTEQKVAALRHYRTCLVARARALDNHKSDAMTIATAMRGSCRQEMVQMAKATAGGSSVETYREIAASAERREVEAALNAVLAERQEKRGKR